MNLTKYFFSIQNEDTLQDMTQNFRQQAFSVTHWEIQILMTTIHLKLDRTTFSKDSRREKYFFCFGLDENWKEMFKSQ